jgi:hypothetical protein
MDKHFNDLTGMKFGLLTVMCRVSNIYCTKNNPNGIVAYRVLCDCGVLKIIGGYSLTNGQSQSCGCQRLKLWQNKMLIPIEKRDAMIKLYLSGLTAQESASQLGYTKVACLHELQRRNIQSRGRGNTHRYNFNKQYFDNIDTEERAYWLGFLAADGYIDRNGMGFHLAIKDINHLDKFRNAIQSNNPIKYDKKTCSINLSSAILLSKLEKYHLTANKTSRVYAPILDKDLMHHYWRGAFDGDGCIHKNTQSKWLLIFVGNQYMVNNFCDYTHTFIQSHSKIYHRKDTNCYQFTIGGKFNARRLAQELYNNSTIYLDRKYQLFLQLISETE